jgi:UDP-GlcNAc:undecaprenyl-phosphate/decaprenyl-phosphate GlcNAc-1-phosphate transferase
MCLLAPLRWATRPVCSIAEQRRGPRRSALLVLGGVSATTSGYLIVGTVAAVTTFVLTPIAAWLSRRWGAVAVPDERRTHAKPTPALGGLALFGGFAVAVALAWRMDRFQFLFDTFEVRGVVLAAAVIATVGALDDIFEYSAPAKVAGMVLAGVILTVHGVTMLAFRLPFIDPPTVKLSWDLAPLVTVLWVVLMANVINLIDGLDGLAAGIVAIGSGAFFLYSSKLVDIGMFTGPNIGPLLAVITCGICLGFLPHNFNPARIFMGDCGALLLGLLLAASTTVVGGRAEQAFSGQTYFFFAPLFIPLVILGVPVLDTVFAVMRRVARRRSFSEADREHLHHRLVRLGHGPRRSVLILWAWTAILSAFVLYPTYNDGQGDAVVPFGIAALGLTLFTVLHPLRNRDAV